MTVNIVPNIRIKKIRWNFTTYREGELQGPQYQEAEVGKAQFPSSPKVTKIEYDDMEPGMLESITIYYEDYSQLRIYHPSEVFYEPIPQ